MALKEKYTKEDRQKAILKHLQTIAECGCDTHVNYTPPAICDMMLENVQLGLTKNILVLYNIELLFALSKSGYKGKVTFFTQSSKKALIAPKIFNDVSVEYIIKETSPLDFMESKWPNKFDIIIANPPYTNGKDKHFYVKFIDSSNRMLKENGYLVMVTPNTWIENKHRVFKKLSDDGCFHVINEKDGDSDFGIALGRKTSYFVYEKGSEIKGVLKHNILNEKNGDILKIVDKIYGRGFKGKGGQSGLEKKDFSEIETPYFSYPVFLSSGERSNLFYHQPIKGSGISKLITSNILEPGKAERFSEVSTDKGVGRYSTFYEMSEEEAINAQQWFNTSCFKFCDFFTRKGRYTKSLLPDFDFSEAWDDEKIFKLRNLTKEEIEIIKGYA